MFLLTNSCVAHYKYCVFLLLQCSVTCGMGIRTRMAECKYLNGTAAAISLCNENLGAAPAADKEECSAGRDCLTECRDDDGYKDLCPKVKSGNLCSNEIVRQQCCQTCREAD